MLVFRAEKHRSAPATMDWYSWVERVGAAKGLGVQKIGGQIRGMDSAAYLHNNEVACFALAAGRQYVEDWAAATDQKVVYDHDDIFMHDL